MKSIILIRHGETEWNRKYKINGITDIKLSDIGKMQAKLTGFFLEQMNLEDAEFISSPMLRAVETAKEIKKVLNIPFSVEESLRERDYGILEGQDSRNIDWNNLSDTVETSMEIFERLDGFVEYLKNNNFKNSIIVTHASIVRHMVYLLLGMDVQIRAGNASVSVINTDGFESNPDTKFFDFQEHLKGEKDEYFNHGRNTVCR